MTLETIVPLASLIFYGIILIAAFALAVYKIVIKVKNGENVIPDIDALSDKLVSILTKKSTKYLDKNKLSYDSEKLTEIIHNAVTESVQSIEQKNEKKTN